MCVTRLPPAIPAPCSVRVHTRSCSKAGPPPDAKKLTRYPRTPPPYVLEPPDRRFDSFDGGVHLGLTLFGRANEHLPYVVHALEEAGRSGLTARRVALDLVEVQAESWEGDTRTRRPEEAQRDQESRSAGAGAPTGWTTIFEPGGRLAPAPLLHPFPPAPPPAVRVRLLSPLRIKRREHFVGGWDFDFRAFLGALLRRISLLTSFFGDVPLETDFKGLLKLAEAVPVREANLRWHEWSRHSARQKTRLQMGGLVGSFELEGAVLGPFWPYVWLGQWTHAGKGCTMGLGRYVLAPFPALMDSTDRSSAGRGAPLPTLGTDGGRRQPASECDVRIRIPHPPTFDQAIRAPSGWAFARQIRAIVSHD